MGYVITSVARKGGRPVHDVARESYALTLWTRLQHQEEERIGALTARADRLDSAFLVHFAFAKPGELLERHRWLQAELRRKPGAALTNREALMRDVAAIEAALANATKVKRITLRKAGPIRTEVHRVR